MHPFHYAIKLKPHACTLAAQVVIIHVPQKGSQYVITGSIRVLIKLIKFQWLNLMHKTLAASSLDIVGNLSLNFQFYKLISVFSALNCLLLLNKLYIYIYVRSMYLDPILSKIRTEDI